MMKFTKMVATGNDFIMIDNRKNIINNRAEFAREYCAPHFGVGADGVIFIEKPLHITHYTLHVDFKMRIFNPDGSEAEMCGNGARCTAVFAYLKHIVKKPQMKFQTLAGIISAIVVNNKAKIEMSKPSDLELNKKIMVDGKKLTVHYINTGVPHTVLISKDVKKVDIMKSAPGIRYHKVFPNGTNVDFIQVLNNRRIKMRTYERGVEGETLACGTGATASAIISALLGYTKSPVGVVVPGGTLKISFETGTHIRNIFLEGEARVVYEGEITNAER